MWSRALACRTIEIVVKGLEIGTTVAAAGSTARIVNGLIQSKENLILRKVASLPFLAPWPTEAAEFRSTPNCRCLMVRRSAKGVHDGGVTAVETRYADGFEFSDGAAGTVLTGDGEVDMT